MFLMVERVQEEEEHGTFYIEKSFRKLQTPINTEDLGLEFPNERLEELSKVDNFHNYVYVWYYLDYLYFLR